MKESYRPDIDGLRAVAVLAVVGFHAFPRWIPGGFVGVDVFFVISGFLISSIIIGSLAKDSFSFTEFYSRRIRRIFPALAVVLVFCYGFGWFSLLADEYRQLGKHIAGAAGFVANVLLWRESGYFDNAVATKPLVHLWSLGVEEQFYIVWPLLLYVAWRRRFPLLPFILLIVCGSFVLSVRTIRSDAVAAFYSPVTRFWEILLGGALAATVADKRPTDATRANIVVPHVTSLLGFGLIVAAVAGVTRTKTFPGWWALFPTLGAYFVISAGKDAWFNRAVLSWRALVWLGLISYPLYLWHWAFLSFATIISSDHTVPKEVRVAIVLMSVVLASLTYRLVETPVRSGRVTRAKAVVLSGLMLAIGLVGYVTYTRGGVPSRIKSTRNDPNSRATRAWRIDGTGVVDCSSAVKPYTPSSYCASTGTPTVAIIGDSHAGHLFYGFLHSGDEFFGQPILIGAGSCWPTLDAEVRDGCNKQLLIALDMIRRSTTIKYVVLSGYYLVIDKAGSPLAKTFAAGYVKTFKALHEMGQRIVFVVDPPTFRSDPESCLRQRPIERMFPRFFLKPRFCVGAKGEELRSHAEYDAFVGALKNADRDVLFYDPADALCRNNTCKVFEGDKLLFLDWNHLSIYGSQYVARDLIAHLR